MNLPTASHYRARYYDPQAGRLLSEDPLRFGTRSRVGFVDFYPYVGNNPVKRKDPSGLWQVEIGGGGGLGVLVTFGKNSGQWNLGFYWGAGAGLFGSYDPTDSGCHSPGFVGGPRAEGLVGLGDYVSASSEVDINGEGFERHVSVNVNLPDLPGPSLTWDPDKPNEPPHGVLAGGVGGFGGIGGTSYSAAPCGCGAK